MGDSTNIITREYALLDQEGYGDEKIKRMITTGELEEQMGLDRMQGLSRDPANLRPGYDLIRTPSSMKGIDSKRPFRGYSVLCRAAKVAQKAQVSRYMSVMDLPEWQPATITK